VQGGGLCDTDGVIVHCQPGRTFEGQRAATGTRIDDYRLSGTQFAGHDFAEMLGAIGRADNVNQLGVSQGLVNVMARPGNWCEPGDIALGMDSALLCDRRDVVGNVVEIEHVNVVPVRRTIECHGSAAGTCT
jgi:hypothetical protein